MNKALAHIHFKRPFGDPRRFKELKHQFKASPTAQYLIDYAAANDITMVDRTRDLEARGWGGSYNHEHRVIEYSHLKPAVNLFHEFRHPQQMDAMDVHAPEMIKDARHPDLRRAFMAVAIMETDACFYQETVYHEIDGEERKLDPERYFRVFLSTHIDHWLADVAARDFSVKSVFAGAKEGKIKDLLQTGERLYDTYLLRHADQKLEPLHLTSRERKADKAYLKACTDVVCLTPEGENYLLAGKSEFEVDETLGKIWQAIFTKDRQTALRLSRRKDTQNEAAQVFLGNVYAVGQAIARLG
ncbi:MAG: hypothetical protein WC043_03865 [Pseudobdellovibrionaceae bacterium]